jgi:hypothetical protein
MEPAKIVLRALAIFCGFAALFGLVCSWISPEAYTLKRPEEFIHWPLPAFAMLRSLFDFVLFSAAIGIGTAFAAHVGHRPAVKAFFFTRPMLMLAAITAVIGTIGGWLGRELIIAGNYQFQIPPERHAAYLGTWWAVLTSQAVMLIGGATLAIWTWRKRIYFEKLVQSGELRKK